MLPFAHRRHGTHDAGGNDATSGEEPKKRPGGGDWCPTCRRTELAGPGLHKRCDRPHGEPGPVRRRRSSALGKKGCCVAPVDAPGADDQPVHVHEVIVEVLQPLVGLACSGHRTAARGYTLGPEICGQ